MVIPYFQREHSILRRALASVAAQQDCGLPVRVVVVDDASPVAAAAELERAEGLKHLPVQVLRQENGGPGAARNSGLEAATGARYVAFLDSDDTWSPDHLSRAVAALEEGYDFFFANHLQLGATQPAFERAGRLDPAAHPQLTASPDLHAYAGDMLAQIATGNVIGTSTVVYRYERFAAQRFQVEFRSAGEDYLFWIALVDAHARLCFSTQVHATYGRGVNVYAGAAWGSRAHLQRVHDESRYKRRLLCHRRLHDHHRAALRDQLNRLRRDFIGSLASMVSRGQRPPLALLARYLRCDPWWPVHVPVVALQRALRLR
ncbi:MAG: glycosyltransferase family 2 protein [Aquabacterium sp.]|nr:glycosyltransferase family 2 protein [Aquabacterium sp.]